MKTNHLFSAFAAGSLLVYSMMLLVGVKPNASASSSPKFINIPHHDDAQENTLSGSSAKFGPEFENKLDTNFDTNFDKTPESEPAATRLVAGAEDIVISKIKADFFNQKINSIGRNAEGHYVVNISAANEQPILIQSSTPIYYPTEADLNYGVQGCVLGGYYIELNHHIALITQDNTTAYTTKNQHNYRCDYNSTTNSYTLTDI